MWKTTKSKRQLKEERKWENDKSFPPLPVLSSTIKNGDKSGDDSKSSSSIKSFTTPNKKPSIQFRRVTSESNEIKIAQEKSEQKGKMKMIC